VIFLHFVFSLGQLHVQQKFKPPARSSQNHLFLPPLEPRPLH
jgi:hypothetical protein